ncbi:hypothetical protein DSO57_1005217 [Entomophthora muscae]|uniref:Uncharacterized protein n=1 Tax=Entomophthora muscae TaxID=34485 RepID=A0ACC2T7T9_9FUNG|nr:hypothetical protein DSO57_1005217 [Entomophthora muscae]
MIVLNTLSSFIHSSPPPNMFNILAYSQAQFTAFSKDFPTNTNKVLFLAEKLTDHYHDWFCFHSVRNPEVFQDYDLFISSLLSFTGKDKDSAAPSSSCFSGLVQGSLPLRKYNWKFCSLQSRLQASDAEACSFNKIGLNPSLQDFLVHHKIPEKLDSLIKEVVKWNWKYFLTNSSSTSKLSPNAKTFSSKTTTLPTPPPGTEPRHGGGFFLTSEEIFRRRTNNLCSYFGSKDHLLALCPLSKQSTPVNSSISLNSLMSKDSSISSTVLVTVHSPLGKVKVLALLDISANAIFIKKNLADSLRLPLYGSLNVKIRNSTYTDASSITQPVTFDLEGSTFCIKCNSTPNLSYPFILGFPWLKECFLKF